MEENVKKLEVQLKDQFKGQLDMVAMAKENIEMTNRVREMEKKLQLYTERLKEYDEIMRGQTEEVDRTAKLMKTVRAENEGLKATNAHLEE